MFFLAFTSWYSFVSTLLLVSGISALFLSGYFRRQRPNWLQARPVVRLFRVIDQFLGQDITDKRQTSSGESSLLEQYKWEQYTMMSSIGKAALEAAFLRELSKAIERPIQDDEAKCILEFNPEIRNLLLECWELGDLGRFWSQYIFSTVAQTKTSSSRGTVSSRQSIHTSPTSSIVTSQTISESSAASELINDTHAITMLPAVRPAVEEVPTPFNTLNNLAEEYVDVEEHSEVVTLTGESENDTGIEDETYSEIPAIGVEDRWFDDQGVEDIGAFAHTPEVAERKDIVRHSKKSGQTRKVEIYGGNFTHIAGNNYALGQSHYRKVAEWFSSTDLRLTHNHIVKKRSKNTGVWFLASEAFNLWKADPDIHLLWCPGDPGVGKTTLASLFIDHLRELRDESTILGFIYFDHKRHAKQDLTWVLECLARQTYEACQGTASSSYLEGLFREHERDQSRLSLERLSVALAESWKHFQNHFVVVDAVDEYGHFFNLKAIRDLLGLLFCLKKDVKVLVTSRAIEGMEELFHDFGGIKQDILADEDDMSVYLHERIRNANYSFEVSSYLERAIITSVKLAARGRFLLAELHMNTLAEKINPGFLEDALVNLPNEIDETYEDTLKRIKEYPPAHREMALTTIAWVARSFRPLGVRELQHALATTPNCHHIDKYITPFSTIAALCAGLVRALDGVVAFVHISAQQFFDNPRIRSEYFTDAEDDIVRACMDYIGLPRCIDIVPGLEFAGWLDQSKMSSIVFYDYASRHLGLHAQASGPKQDRFQQFLSRNDRAIQVCCAYILAADPALNEHNSCQDLDVIMAPNIFLAIYYGQTTLLPSLFDSLIKEPCTAYGRTPLIIAAILNRESAIDTLLAMSQVVLDKTTNSTSLPLRIGGVNAYDCMQSTALHYAVSGGHLAIVNQLLGTKGIHVNSTDSLGRTPLAIAAETGQSRIATTLLNHDRAGIHHLRNEGWSPLTSAALYGHDDIVSLLLNYNEININHTDHSDRTPISYAARYGRDRVVALLLKHGKIDVNMVDVDGQSPLLWAARNGHATVVKLLLSHRGIELNLADPRGWTPLDWAIHKGHDVIIDLLSHAAIDQQDNRRDDETWTVLPGTD